MNISVNKKALCEIITMVVLCLLADISIYMAGILSIWIVVFSIYKLLKTKNNLFFLLELFMLVYSIIPLYYFVLGYQIDSYQKLDLNQYDNMLAITKIQSLFIVFFLNSIPLNNEKSFKKSLIIKKRPLAWLFSLFVMLSCFILIDWGKMKTVLINGYSTEGAGSILFNYFVIFALINYIYSDTYERKKINMILTSILACASLLTGARMATIILGILVYILHFEENMRKKHIVLIFVGAFLFFTAFQFIRVKEIPTLNDLLGNNANVQILANNQGDVWYASEVIYKLIDEGIFDTTFRIKSFWGTFLNAFLTTSLTPEEALVNMYIMNHKLFVYPNGGGLIGITTYLWLGYLGPIISAVILGRIIRKGLNKVNEGYVLAAILVLVTLPKWYTYEPRILFKFAFVGVVMYLITKITAYFSIRRVN